jgi:hypothetical protein
MHLASQAKSGYSEARGDDTMTELLAKAFKEVSKLPQENLAGEMQWDETLARSQDLLERLADEALEDYRAGRTEEMGIHEL